MRAVGGLESPTRSRHRRSRMLVVQTPIGFVGQPLSADDSHRLAEIFVSPNPRRAQAALHKTLASRFRLSARRRRGRIP